MKKVSVLFSVIAITFAVASSFAFSAAPTTTLPTFINTSADEPFCDDADVVCPGGNTPCSKLVPSVGTVEAIWHYQPTGCKQRLTMP